MSKDWKIPVRSIRLLIDARAFHVAVMEKAQDTNTYKEAYEAVEKEIEEKTGHRHYPESGYFGYKVTKSRLQKKDRKARQLKLFKE